MYTAQIIEAVQGHSSFLEFRTKLKHQEDKLHEGAVRPAAMFIFMLLVSCFLSCAIVASFYRMRISATRLDFLLICEF